MAIITTAICKTYLDIDVGTTTWDADIAAKIPIIDSLVKRITKNKFTLEVLGATTNLSTTFTISSIYTYAGICYGQGSEDLPLNDILTVGQLITGTGIPDGAYIADINSFGYTSAPYVTLSSAATATGSISALTGVPVDLLSIVSKGIWWMIENDSKTIKDDTWISRSIGPMSVSRNDADSKIDACGMPLWFVKAFPRFQGAC